MTPVAPRQQPATLQEIIRPHIGITTAGGSYRCTCLHTYEAVLMVDGERPYPDNGQEVPKVRDPEQRLIVDELHAQHIAERLLAAGVEPPRPKDPREDLRRRIGGQR